MKKTYFSTLLLLICFSMPSVWADNAPKNTILWGESFDHFGTKTPSAAGTGAGTIIYDNAVITYAAGNIGTIGYNNALAGGTAPELLLKGSDEWSISGIHTGHAKVMELTFLSNKTAFAVSSSATEYIVSGSGKSWTFTLADGATAPDTLKLFIKNTASSTNARIDNVRLTVTTAAGQATATLTDIQISGTPTTTSYLDGDKFDFTGLTATAVYSDNSTADVTNDANWKTIPETLTETTTSVSVIATYDTQSDTLNNIAVSVAARSYAQTYTSGVYLSQNGGTSASTGKVIIDGNDYFALKAGTSSNAGAVKITVPANTSVLHFHMAGWSSETVIVSITSMTVNDTLSIPSDGGVSGSSSFPLEGNTDTDEYFTLTTNNANELVLTFTAIAGKRFIIYGVNAEEGTGLIATPVFTPVEEYAGGQVEVSLAADEGMSIYYTLDGTTPTTSSTLYTAPFTLTNTTTVKAFATDGTKSSEVATKTYTIIPNITCAQANSLEKDQLAVLGDFRVVYVNGMYIYIKDDSGYTLLYKSGYGLKAGDRVSAGMQVKGSSYNGLPECVPVTPFSDLTVTDGEIPAPETMTAAPNMNEINRIVKFEKVRFTEDTTWNQFGGQYNYFPVRDSMVICYNTFKVDLDFDTTKVYDVYGAVSCYRNTVQLAIYEIVETLPGVAAIGSTYYQSLTEAIAASQDGDIVKLLCDAEGPTCEITKAIVLDLNDHAYNITNTTNPNDVRGFICLANGNILVKNGKINVVNDMQIICFDCNRDTLTLTDVIFDVTICEWYGAAARANSGTCVIMNGNTSVNAGTWHNRVVQVCGNNTQKGTCIINSTSNFDGGNIEFWGGKLKIYSGTFSNITWYEAHYTDGDVAIYGGTFSDSIPQKYCAEGYRTIMNADSTYTVELIPVIAAIGTQTYSTLVEAIAAALDGDTVKLLTDAEGPTCEITKSIVIDLNTHTYNITAATNLWGFYCYSGNNITIKNGTLKAIRDLQTACIEGLCDSLILTDVTIDITTCSSNTYGIRVDNYCLLNGTTSIYAASDGTLNSCIMPRTGNQGPATCIINSTGSFTGMIMLYGGKLQIQSGNFTNYSWFEASTSYHDGDVAIYGGTFSAPVPEKYCAKGYRPVTNADRTYTVELIPVAAIGNNTYSTLVEAIAASQDGDIVKLLCDAEGPTCEITKAIVLDLNDHAYNITNKTTPGDGRGFICLANGNILVKNGKINVANDMQIVCFDCNCDTLTLTDVTIDVSICEWYGIGVWADNQNTYHNFSCVILNGNTSIYTGTGYNSIAEISAYNSKAGTCIFNSTGIFDGGNMDLWGGKIEIYSGNFKNTTWNESSRYTDGDVAIYGGTFSAPVPQKYCAEGYAPATLGDGSYSVVELTSVALNKKTTYLAVDGKDTLSVAILPAIATPEVVWTSDNDSVASVVDGVVSAKASGTAHIIVAAGSLKDTCEVIVLREITNTPDSAYTVSEAVKLISDLTADRSKPVYVKGVVSGIPMIDVTDKGTAFFYITDGEMTMTMLDVLDLDSAKFTDPYKVGDKDTVIMYGIIDCLTSYNNAMGLTNGYIWKLTKSEATGTGFDALNADRQKAIKIIRDNQVIIIRNGKQYNVNGTAL